AHISAMVVGLGTIDVGQSLTAPAGSYDLQVTAEGYQEITVTREILPGVTSVLSFDLEPIAVATAPDELPAEVASTVMSNLARFSASRFRTAPTCGTAHFVGGGGLLLTTYSAIRGAEELAIELPDGRKVDQDISVAAWDAERDIAVLKLPLFLQDSLRPTTVGEGGQFAWAFAHPACDSAEVTRSRLARWPDEPLGPLALSDSLPQPEQGGPIVNRAGEVLGLTTGPLSAIPAHRWTDVVNAARRNVVTRSLESLHEVARRENHLYGSVAIQSSLTDAIAQITPLESWHWPGLALWGTTPLTFSGPLGRYALELHSGDPPPYRTEFEIDPGLFKEIAEPQVIVSDGGGFPVPIAIAGAVGAGAVVALIALGGGDDGGGTEPTPTPTGTEGWITVIIPTHP
ncbi:MAG: trypsin-like peptidase domain-containing protein, partial [Gemmatimonadota bacterium]